MSWRMLRAQIVVEQRIFWRNLSTMFFTFVLPIVMLVLVVFGGGGGGSDVLAMIVSLGIISTGFQGLAMQLAMHRDQGVLKGIMATPMSPLTFVAAKVASVLVVVAIEVLVVLVVGEAFTDASLPVHPVGLALLLVVGTATFVAIGFAVASVIPSADAAPAIVNAAYLAMVLVAAVLARMDDLPAVVRTVGDALPLGSLVTSLENAWSGGPGHVLGPTLVMLAWCAFAALWTVRRFRWEPREALH